MPVDRYLTPDDDASDYAYQLGLDREPELEFRSPRCIFGDPGQCDLLEKLSPFKNSSCNLILGWEEWLSDVQLIGSGRAYIEDCLLVGVPPSYYAYSLVRHDEPVDMKVLVCTNAKRSAIHGKIVNRRLPTGGFLHPFYARRNRLLTCLFLAHLSITNNWSFALDPGSERNLVKNHSGKLTPLAQLKAQVEETVRSIKLLPTGKPDVKAIFYALEARGIDEIEAIKGLAGRRGIRLRFEDHPNPVRFFGEPYKSLNKYIKKNHPDLDENAHDNKPSAWEQYFPDGELVRTGEFPARIAAGLAKHLAARANYNIHRYGIDRPIFVFGDLALGRDGRGDCSSRRLDGVDREGKPDAARADRSQIGIGPAKPIEALDSVTQLNSSTGSIHSTVKSHSQKSYEHHADTHTNNDSNTASAALPVADPYACRTHSDLAVLAARTLANAAGNFGARRRAIEGLHGAIGARCESGGLWAEAIDATNRRLGEALQRFSKWAKGVGEMEGDGLVDPSGEVEFVRRVRRPPRAPSTQSGHSQEQ